MLQCDLKYIDPSYMIRASPTITTDRIYCKARPHRLPPRPARASVSGSLNVAASAAGLAPVVVRGALFLPWTALPA